MDRGAMMLGRGVILRGCQIPLWSSLGLHPPVPTSLSHHGSGQRSLHSVNEGGEKSTTTGAMPLCQLNCHPDFRLCKTRAKVELEIAKGRGASAALFGGGGTSSGALVRVAGTGGQTTKNRKTAVNNDVKKKIRPFKMAPSPSLWKAPRRRRFNKVVKENGLSIISSYENPVRSSDGTSSGALAEERLRVARRKALESMTKPLSSMGQTEQGVKNAGVSELAPKNGGEINVAVIEHNLVITLCENPTRPNDGTSSGALAADRLRMARRKALESMGKQSPVGQSGQGGTNEAHAFMPETVIRRGEKSNGVKERGLKILASENPIRSNDGTSSGALVADRLRMARRKALESMSAQSCVQCLEVVTQATEPKMAIDTMRQKTEGILREHGLALSTYENPIRFNDGTSSGARVADRLRIARRKAIESLKRPSID